MADKVHCWICGFLMMMESKDGEVAYTCVNTHSGGPLHELENIYDLGANMNAIMKWLKSDGI
jgi:hypothetical protein